MTNRTPAVWASVSQATAPLVLGNLLCCSKQFLALWHLLLWVFVGCFGCPYLLFHLAISLKLCPHKSFPLSSLAVSAPKYEKPRLSRPFRWLLLTRLYWWHKTIAQAMISFPSYCMILHWLYWPKDLSLGISSMFSYILSRLVPPLHPTLKPLVQELLGRELGHVLTRQLANSGIFAPPVGTCLHFQSNLSGLNVHEFQELDDEARMCCWLRHLWRYLDLKTS